MGEDSLPSSVLYATKQRPHPSVAPPPAAADALAPNGEEPYTIKCICGFDDDTFDGNVVLCDRCNSWQHISCYYYPQTNLEEEFDHQCVDCSPPRVHSVDPSAAASRQAGLRPPSALSDVRKQKRVTAKSHKKSRTRDLTNGNDAWPGHDPHAPEARGHSPRETGPPHKRPKTSHKHSASNNISNNILPRPINGRKRSDSFASAEQPKLPLSQCPPGYLSPDFIRVHYDNTDFRHTNSNLHLNIDITRLLSNWLDDEDAFAEATGGKTHNEVFQHFPQPIEELETPIQKHTHVDKDVEFHGRNPTWPYLTVEADLMQGDFVGELRGFIGRREEYIKDEGNQWPKLRHPDHFVFFHPVLPIYIDSRTEGTLLRYARRSCRPNLKMETIITGAREYRFCFTAMDNIPKGAELTIPWDTTHDGQLLNALRKSLSVMSEDDVLHVSDWVGTILAHFGGCACESPHGNGSNGPCLLAHFDRRLNGKLGDLLQQNGKSRSKKKKVPKSAIPDAEGLVMSRAGSDGPLNNHVDNEADVPDDQSQTHSTDSKSSRDGTPYYSRDSIAANPDLSERDKRKLLQQEKLFEQMEQGGQQQGPRKRKRHSGSNANTPTATTQPRPFGRSSSSQNVNGKVRVRDSPTAGHSVAASPARGRPPAHAPKPVYCDNSTQTEETEPTPPKRPASWTKPFPCRTKQLLKRSLLQNHRRRHAQPVSPAQPPDKTSPSPAPAVEPSIEVADNGPVATASTGIEATAAHAPTTAESAHAKGAAATANGLLAPKEEVSEVPIVEEVSQVPIVKEEPSRESVLKEPDDEIRPEPSTPIEIVSTPLTTKPALENHTAAPDLMQPPARSPQTEVHPAAPPWPSTEENEQGAITNQHSSPAVSKTSMHVELPPPEFTKAVTPTGSPVQVASKGTSPATPSQETAVASRPSIAKKKMSLSDYLKRKTETPSLEKTQSQALTKASSPSEEAVTKEAPSTPTSGQAV